MSSKPKKYINWWGIASVIVFAVLLISYFLVRLPTATAEVPFAQVFWSDFLTLLPYLIVGVFSFVFGFLDLSDKFPDLGVKLPLSNKYGWGYLIFNTFVPIVLLYAYLDYLPTLGVPKIGDVWITSFVVALAFPMLIRSKFFSYTNSSGDNVSVGFDQIYDRLTEAFVEKISRSSRAPQQRCVLLKRAAGLFSKAEDLKKEADMLTRTRPDWNKERREKENESINKIMSSSDPDENKKLDLANYILTTGGEEYFQEMILRSPATQPEKDKTLLNLSDLSKSLSGSFVVSGSAIT